MSTQPCKQCKTSFVVPSTGRPKQFCSDRCRLTFHRRAKKARGDLAVPNDLAVADRWVRHVKKRPVTPSGRPVSVTDPSTWSPLVEATESTVGEGLGYVLGEGVGCIDFDNVIDEEGRLDPVVEWLMWDLRDTWIEVSPSGRGLHIWGLLPETPGRVFQHKGASVEVYSRDRYITVTGNPFRNAPLKLNDLSGFVAKLEDEA